MVILLALCFYLDKNIISDEGIPNFIGFTLHSTIIGVAYIIYFGGILLIGNCICLVLFKGISFGYLIFMGLGFAIVLSRVGEPDLWAEYPRE